MQTRWECTSGFSIWFTYFSGQKFLIGAHTHAYCTHTVGTARNLLFWTSNSSSWKSTWREDQWLPGRMFQHKKTIRGCLMTGSADNRPCTCWDTNTQTSTWGTDKHIVRFYIVCDKGQKKAGASSNTNIFCIWTFTMMKFTGIWKLKIKSNCVNEGHRVIVALLNYGKYCCFFLTQLWANIFCTALLKTLMRNQAAGGKKVWSPFLTQLVRYGNRPLTLETSFGEIQIKIDSKLLYQHD